MAVTTWQQIRAIEEEQQMAYITTAERIGHSMGLAEGRTEGLREAITMTLNTRFDTGGGALLPLLQQIAEPDTLHALFNQILGVTTLDEARAAIDEAIQAAE